jgi:UDP-N-acetylmuramyl pentapeptide synthase
MVRPHAAVVTTVGPVHTENFPDGEAGVARAKAEVFEGLQKGGVAVLNADDRWFGLLKAEAEAAGAEVRTFGRAEGCDARLIDFQGAGSHAVVQARFHGKGLDFPILQTGMHWGLNSMAVLLMLEALDVDLGGAGLLRAAGGPRRRDGGAPGGRRLHPDRRELQRQPDLHGLGHRHPWRPQDVGPQGGGADRHAGIGP